MAWFISLSFITVLQVNLPLPEDIKIIGISLSTILLFVGAFVKNVVFKGKDERKLTPWIVMVVGIVLSAGAGLVFFPDSPQDFAGYVAYGLMASIAAVGAHSTAKNTVQYIKKKQG